ncbi:hypothetical protein COLO4_04316 [Corchorus olitorius]|uniref:Uncharacterized protein n=1 Tax=Corchorus olitorius TaxID=93759 RepID=A0A1R3KUE5_9ROSI|nr:hypothetical protein COLO4_04316 [Corchorus olitorius]
MEASSSNQENVNPSSWKKGDLREPIRELVEVLEALLEVRFPHTPPRIEMENSDRLMMMDIAKLIIGYHQYTNDKEIASEEKIFQWLNIRPDEIPSPESIFKQLQKPLIISVLTSHGLASYKLPLMAVRIYHPSLEHIELTSPNTTCNKEGYKHVCYLYTAENIVQGRISIKTDILTYL